MIFIFLCLNLVHTAHSVGRVMALEKAEWLLRLSFVVSFTALGLNIVICVVAGWGFDSQGELCRPDPFYMHWCWK